MAQSAYNQKRDNGDMNLFRERGWRMMVVWEYALFGKHATPPKEVTQLVRI